MKFFFAIILQLCIAVDVPAFFVNGTISRQTIQYQFGQNGTSFSYYTPELVCQSCSGNSTCNNTSPLCVKRLIDLSYNRTDTSNKQLLLQTYSVNAPQTILTYPVTNVFYCSGRCTFTTTKRQATILSLSYRTLLINNDVIYATSVQWVKGEDNGFFACPTSGDCTYELPANIFVKDGILTVRVYVGETLNKVVSFPIDATQVCDIKDCEFICYEYLTNFLCYSKTTQILVGFSFACSILLLVTLFGFLTYKIYACMKDKYTIRLPQGTQIAACILICCIVSAEANCLSTTTVSVPIRQCTFQNGNYRCTVSLNSIVTLPVVGSQACFRFTNEDGDSIGYLNFTYINSILQAPLATKYYTADWLPRQWSDKSCRNTATCPSSGCQDPEATLNSINPETMLVTGYSTCESSCGCAGCGCFFCADACLYSKYGFLPTAIFDVKNIGPMSILPRVQVDYNFNGTPGSTLLDVQNTLTTPDFVVTLLGSFVSTTYDLSETSVTFSLDGTNRAWLQNSAPAGSPVFGQIGDIQASTLSQFQTTPAKFIFPATAIPHTSQQSSASYIFPVPAMSIASTGISLPRLWNGVVWSANQFYIYGLNPTPPAIQLTLSSTATNMSLLSETVCPQATTYRITGCYSCPEGFTITVSLKSACQNGGISVDADSTNFFCVTSFISITTTFTDYYIYCNSVSKAPYGTLNFKGDTQTSLFVSGALSEPPAFNETLVRQIFENSTVKFQDFGSFWDAFQGNAAVFKYTVIAVAAAISLLTVGATLMSLYTWKKLSDEHQFVTNYLHTYDKL